MLLLTLLALASPPLVHVQAGGMCGGVVVEVPALRSKAALSYILTGTQEHCFPKPAKVLTADKQNEYEAHQDDELPPFSFSISPEKGDVGALAVLTPLAGVPIGSHAPDAETTLWVIRGARAQPFHLEYKSWKTCKDNYVTVTYAKTPKCYLATGPGHDTLGDGDSGSPVLQGGKVVGLVSEIEPTNTGAWIAIQPLPSGLQAHITACATSKKQCTGGGGAIAKQPE